MAELTTGKRQELWAELMSNLSRDREEIAIIKSDLRAAVDAIDVFLNDNASTINNAFPTVAKDNLTTSQKARLLNYVVRYRYIEGA